MDSRLTTGEQGGGRVDGYVRLPSDRLAWISEVRVSAGSRRHRWPRRRRGHPTRRHGRVRRTLGGAALQRQPMDRGRPQRSRDLRRRGAHVDGVHPRRPSDHTRRPAAWSAADFPTRRTARSTAAATNRAAPADASTCAPTDASSCALAQTGRTLPTARSTPTTAAGCATPAATDSRAVAAATSTVSTTGPTRTSGTISPAGAQADGERTPHRRDTEVEAAPADAAST